jgi:hypothetical protein
MLYPDSYNMESGYGIAAGNAAQLATGIYIMSFLRMTRIATDNVCDTYRIESESGYLGLVFWNNDSPITHSMLNHGAAGFESVEAAAKNLRDTITNLPPHIRAITHPHIAPSSPSSPSSSPAAPEGRQMGSSAPAAPEGQQRPSSNDQRLNMMGWEFFMSLHGFNFWRDNGILMVQHGAPTTRLVATRSIGALDQIRDAVISLRPELESVVLDMESWISYINFGLGACAAYVETEEERQDFIMEQIDKAHRRGVMSDNVNFTLQHHFNLSI